MFARFTLIITAAMLATAIVAPAALAASPAPPVELAPGEKVVSHSTTTAKDSQYVVELLSSIKSVKIDADKTTVLINDGKKTHPIEIDYGHALGGSSKGGVAGKLGATQAFAATTDGGVGGKGAGAVDSAGDGSGGGIGLGQIAGILIGLTIISRVIGIVRQLGGRNR